MGGGQRKEGEALRAEGEVGAQVEGKFNVVARAKWVREAP